MNKRFLALLCIVSYAATLPLFAVPAPAPAINQKIIDEALDKVMRMFPEERANIRANRKELIEFISKGKNPPATSALLKVQHAAPSSGPLMSKSKKKTVLGKQWQNDLVSVTIDSVCVGLSMMSVSASYDTYLKTDLKEAMAAEIASMSSSTASKFSKAIENFKQAETKTKQAKAFCKVAGAVWSIGGFSQALKVIKKHSSWWEWVKLSVIIVAQGTAWFLTDGVALAAEVVVAMIGVEQLVEDCVKFSKDYAKNV